MNPVKEMGNSLPRYPDMSPLSKQIPPWEKFKKLSPLGKGLMILLILVVIGGFFVFKKELLNRNMSNKQPSDLIMVVGEEKIYKKDLDMAATYYPMLATSSANINNKLLLEQLIEDSVILQEARNEKLSTLSAQVYNSAEKNFPMRVSLVMQYKKDLMNKLKPYVAGAYVAIFFDNRPNNKSSDQVQKDKQAAFEKMDRFYSQVKNKQIDIKKAGEMIKSDTSLKFIDPVYQANAYGEFKVSLDKIEPTFVKDFNDAVAKLRPGELTPLILGKDKDTKNGVSYDAIYIFGVISDRSEKQLDSKSFVDQIKGKYNVKYY